MEDPPEWFTSPLREVRCEPLFLEQLESLAINPKRFDEAMAGLEDSLSRSPETFPQVPFSPFSRALVNLYSDAPPLRIYFVYDAILVKLVYMEFAE
jgi:hypothetical protein